VDVPASGREGIWRFEEAKEAAEKEAAAKNGRFGQKTASNKALVGFRL
jgi:hypothetical protein